jgi:uncharacterized protein involved in type VI secretion and phage assembly
MLNRHDLQKPHAELEDEYVGTVEDHEDPKGLGRLRVRVPELYGDIPKDHLPWATPTAGFGGGSGYGVFMIPKPGAKVRVKLFRGHPWSPQWIGTHWANQEAPKESQISPPHNYVIKTPKGHLLDMHDDRPYIRIRDTHGNYIIINTEKDDIDVYVGNDLRHETGHNHDETVGNSKRVRTKNYLDEKIGSSRRTKALAAIDFDAGAAMNLRAGGVVNIEAGAVVNILGGGAVNIEGDAAVSVSAGGLLSLDAPIIKINSGTSTPASPARPQSPE